MKDVIFLIFKIEPHLYDSFNAFFTMFPKLVKQTGMLAKWYSRFWQNGTINLCNVLFSVS